MKEKIGKNMKKSICISICTLVIANVFICTVIAQIPKIDDLSEKKSNTKIYDENNIYNTNIIRNNPPIMDYISGPKLINFTKQPNRWLFHAYDNDSWILEFHIDWGDGRYSLIPYQSCRPGGAYGYADHTYIIPGNYTITAYAQDEQGASSEPMTFDLIVKTSKSINTPFQNLIQNHPNIFPIL